MQLFQEMQKLHRERTATEREQNQNALQAQLLQLRNEREQMLRMKAGMGWKSHHSNASAALDCMSHFGRVSTGRMDSYFPSSLSTVILSVSISTWSRATTFRNRKQRPSQSLCMRYESFTCCAVLF